MVVPFDAQVEFGMEIGPRLGVPLMFCVNCEEVPYAGLGVIGIL